MHARRATLGFRLTSLLWIAYFVVGVVIASDHKYFEKVDKVEQVLEAILAVVLWPLVLLGVDMRF
jgi:uncharacterized membrane protein